MPGSPGVGYEAQINSTHKDPNKTGSLDLARGGILKAVRESPVPPGTWFTLEVIAEGNHLVIKVNGKTTVDLNDRRSALPAAALPFSSSHKLCVSSARSRSRS